VILVTGSDFPDALSAAATASRAQASILLTRRDCVPPAVMSEIYRLGVSSVMIIGGTGAVSVNVEKLVPCGPPVSPLFSFLESASGATTGLYSRWDPCDGPIRYQIFHQPGTTLAQAEISAVAVAVSKARAATGYTFQYAGLTTSEVFGADIDAQIGYFDNFGDPDVLGQGGALIGDRLEITKGYADVRRGLSPEVRMDALLHEIGHMLGLDHPEDANQLMWGFITQFRDNYQRGDLEGLRLVGATMPCFPTNRSLHADEPREITWVDHRE
jgi:hypothetical protein